MLDLYEELKRLASILDRHSVAYALCGGLAMAVHGVARATVDIDILISRESFDTARSLPRDLGYTIEAAPISFAGGAVEIRPFSKVDPDSSDVIMVDFLLVTASVEKVWKTREKVEWEQGNLWVVSRTGMIELKQLRRSGQDLDDIARLTEGVDEG